MSDQYVSSLALHGFDDPITIVFRDCKDRERELFGYIKSIRKDYVDLYVDMGSASIRYEKIITIKS